METICNSNDGDILTSFRTQIYLIKKIFGKKKKKRTQIVREHGQKNNHTSNVSFLSNLGMSCFRSLNWV